MNAPWGTRFAIPRSAEVNRLCHHHSTITPILGIKVPDAALISFIR